MSQNVEIPVKLETDGQLRLVFVGTGSAFSKKYYQTNLLIIKGTDHLLIDVGSRASEALAKLGLSVTKIRNYLITHSHADHIGGLEEVALINRYAAHQKTTMIITDEYRDALWHMSLEGGCSFNEEHGGKNLGYDDFFIQASPLPVKGFEDFDLRQINLGSIDIKIFRTRHIPDSAPTWRESFFSYGIILDNRVLFTADTRFDPEVIIRFDRTFGFEKIFHDCQFFTGGVHASFDELSSLPEDLKQRIFLTHYGDAMEDYREKAQSAGFAGFAEQWAAYDFPMPAKSGKKAKKPEAEARIAGPN